jgi:hypothetical protein
MAVFKRTGTWGKRIFHDLRAHKTDYTVIIDGTQKDRDFNQRIVVREDKAGKIIKLEFRVDGVYLVDD